jgi:hypothetical protein
VWGAEEGQFVFELKMEVWLNHEKVQNEQKSARKKVLPQTKLADKYIT